MVSDSRSPILAACRRHKRRGCEFWRQADRETRTERDVGARLSVKQRRTSEYSFYQWRKRLAEQLPMKFALVETSRSAPAAVAAVEVMLTSGERLRIAPGIDAATLRLVLSVLREPR